MVWKPRGLTVMLLPEEGGESRTFTFSGRALRWTATVLGLAAVTLVLLVASWWFLAMNSLRGWRLQSLVDSLEAERSQVLSLAEELDQVQAEYDHLRSLFGPSEGVIASDLWLPPSGLPRGAEDNVGQVGETDVPTSWPLTQAGYITQPLVAQGAGDHPGLDIAVPSDSYIRASGAGRVVRLGEDPLYGFFVVLEHADGYQTVYAHASSILVERGQLVRRQEVIALSGSTGQSTAPHLHFEILLDGQPVDPLTMVQQPG